MAALIRRAHELRILTTRQYHYLSKQITVAGIRTREPEGLAVQLERPRLLRKLAEMQYGIPIDFNKLSADTSVSSQELRTILSEYKSREVNDSEGSGKKLLSFPRLMRSASGT